ncbi:MAG TPA: phosphoribosylanthranilate isomerase [Xanthomonadales bacterium]|nr:phosphoribosylanthranilate isomerase [Xanthomonadales bacterium]
MNRVRIKICGLTRAADMSVAVAAGADALGFVFVPSSPRCLQVSAAGMLCSQVPAFVCRVGLFLNQDARHVRSVLKQVPLNLLQFHGDEDAEYCRQFGLPYIKAVSMQSGQTVAAAEEQFHDAAGILADSHRPGGLGGTGEQLDWTQVLAGRLPLILAGGLNSSNVAAAIKIVRPWAVDVSSGVESSPGIKDANAIRQFIREANSG